MLSEIEKESSTAPGYVLGCKDEKLPLANPRRATGRASEAESQTDEVDSIAVTAASGSGPGLQLLFLGKRCQFTLPGTHIAIAHLTLKMYTKQVTSSYSTKPHSCGILRTPELLTLPL